MLSIQVSKEDFEKIPNDYILSQKIIENLSKERLNNVIIKVKKFCASSETYRPELNINVKIHIFEVELEKFPIINKEYYSDAALLTSDEIRLRIVVNPCRTCMSLWSEYGIKQGYWNEPLLI